MAPKRAQDQAMSDKGTRINPITGLCMSDIKSTDYLVNFNQLYHPQQDPHATYIDHDAYSPSLRYDQTSLNQQRDRTHLKRLTRPHYKVPDLGTPGSDRQTKFVLDEATARHRAKIAPAAQNAKPAQAHEELPPLKLPVAGEVVKDVGEEYGAGREKSTETLPSVAKQRRSTRVQQQAQKEYIMQADNKAPSESHDTQACPEQDVNETQIEVGREAESIDNDSEVMVMDQRRREPAARKRANRPSERTKANASRSRAEPLLTATAHR